MSQAFLGSPHFIGDNVKLLRNKMRTQWSVINVPRGLNPELPKTERCPCLSIGSIFRSLSWGKGAEAIQGRERTGGAKGSHHSSSHSVPQLDFKVLLSVLVGGCLHLHPRGCWAWLCHLQADSSTHALGL